MKVIDIIINDCAAPEGQVIFFFKFINAGTVKAQCAVKIFTDLAVTASNDIANSPSQSTDWSTFIWPIVIAIIIITVAYILIN